MSRAHLLAAAALVPAAIAAAACSSSKSEGGPAPSATAAATAPVAATASASAAPSAGPTASIPAGKLVAGTACGDHPKLPAEELAGEAIDLGGFDIDVYPYPNDASKPPLTGVSRDEAQKLCEARGRRLCTELEWERACKGPSNTRYEYGDRFDSKACPTGNGAIPAYASFEKCASGFGVRAMHGFVWEWTASDWKRITLGSKGVLRGGYGNQPYAHMRCTGVREADTTAKEASVGFRCCGGTANTQEVVIAADPSATTALAVDTAVDEKLIARLERALVNGNYKNPAGTKGEFSRVWRWHPAPKEEIVLASYVTKSAEGPEGIQPFAIRLCDKAVQLIGRLRGPVEKMEDPVVKDDAPGVVTIHVEGGGSSGDVKLTYQFAQVALDQPAWVKAGAPAAATSASAGASASAPPSASAAPAPK
jgi:hypothetical protein